MKKMIQVYLSLLLGVVSIGQASQSGVAGVVTQLKGDALVESKTRASRLQLNGELYVGDRISTREQTRVKLTFNDGSDVVLGDNTQFVIEAYSDDRQSSRMSALFRLVKGVFAAVTDRSFAAPNQREFRVQTKSAVIGVRGTSFWGGYLFSDALDVTMLSGTGIYIENAAGRVEIDAPGLGTTVSTNQAPTQPKQWPDEKLARAKASVAW